MVGSYGDSGLTAGPDDLVTSCVRLPTSGLARLVSVDAFISERHYVTFERRTNEKLNSRGMKRTAAQLNTLWCFTSASLLGLV